jgi:hypothetical protein
VSNDLTVGSDRVNGLEAVIFVRHFFGGTEQNSLCSFIAAPVDGAEWIVGGLLFLRKGKRSEKTQ